MLHDTFQWVSRGSVFLLRYGGQRVTPRTGPYPNAPIVEAVIDIRVTPRPEATLDDLARLRDGEEHRYPVCEKHLTVAGQLVFGHEAVASTGTQTQTGHVFKSEDARQVVQGRFDGFTFSRLAPYDRWETLATEAFRLWERYEGVFRPQNITRLATRYINRLDLPAGPVRLESYLRTYPEVSPDLPQTVTGYFFHLTIPLDELGVQVNLIETIVPQPENPESQAIILDIDAFQDVLIDCTLPTRDFLIPEFNKLRAAKNQVFEASITPEARRSFY